MRNLAVTVFIVSTTMIFVSSEPCPTWFLKKAHGCDCGQQFKSLLKCSKALNEIKIAGGYCLTYNNGTEHFGACSFNANSTSSYLVPRAIPSDVKQCVGL